MVDSQQTSTAAKTTSVQSNSLPSPTLYSSKESLNILPTLLAPLFLPEAEPLYLQVLAIAEQALGENHPTTVKIRENLESLP